MASYGWCNLVLFSHLIFSYFSNLSSLGCIAWVGVSFHIFIILFLFLGYKLGLGKHGTCRGWDMFGNVGTCWQVTRTG